MNFLSDQIGLIISTSIVSTLAAIGLIYFFNFNQNKAGIYNIWLYFIKKKFEFNIKIKRKIKKN